MHCNDANCAGGDDSITTPDTGGFGDVGPYTALELDSSGFPVLSYADADGALKILHCDDPNCSGGGESITSPDIGGRATSLALDASGNPVVSYKGSDFSLKILTCNDPNCSGGDESILSADTVGTTGFDTSIELDASGRPVVSYFEYTFADLKVLHCSDAICAGAKSVGGIAELADVADEPLETPRRKSARRGWLLIGAGMAAAVFVVVATSSAASGRRKNS